MLLNLIIAVIVYAQNVHDKTPLTFSDHSAYLIADLYTALTELRSKERRDKKARRIDTLPVEASWWWDGLPPQTPNVPQMTPLAELALVWVNPEARLAAQPNPKITEFQDIIGRWRDQNQQLRTSLQGLDGAYREAVATSRQLYTDNAQVTSDNEQLQKNNDNFKASISRLNDNITRLIDELQAERDARQSQEQQAARFQSQHARVQTQFNKLFAEKEAAERLATRARRAHNEVLRDFEKESRRRDRSTERQRSTRSRPARTNEGPPIAFDTQKRRRRRSSCVVCKPTECCSDCGKANKWPGSCIVVDELDGKSLRSELPADDAPPVHYATRPYRTL
ncbi:hypothetical protein K491DRAFT_783182 [Lophiostoma macrostomum CBS 122681]|uniref:Uncharacterized protein n=1 Tax=Lophiostoma macrostomum CBS 122681 TaxID=1314788 RepID=A0A6A6STZ5_9PLEO|nr:hypothetical protein K491DRAFT_783182 [Lophiostoma macrostomum CBS 122681]